MHYRRFGRTGWKVSEIGVGMWGMGGWTGSNDEESLRSLPPKLDVKPKAVFQAVRVALTGGLVSPPLFETIELLGPDSTEARLQAALNSL